MSLIPCDEECVYQWEGYCHLETPAIITNMSGNGCAHRIPGTIRGEDGAQNHPDR